MIVLLSVTEDLVFAFIVGFNLHGTVRLLAFPDEDSLGPLSFLFLVECVGIWNKYNMWGRIEFLQLSKRSSNLPYWLRYTLR